MAYIGREPQIGNFQICDAISTVNAQAAYTMQVGSVNVLPETANHMIVSLNGVIQAPISSFTVSGSTITFAANLVTGDVINFIQILGDVLDLGVPSDGTVSTAKLATNAVTTVKITDANVTTAKITDNAITLAKMVHGTDGNIISYDTNGAPVAVATGNDGQVLTSAGAGAIPTFETLPAGGAHTLISTTTISNDATTQITGMNSTYKRYLITFDNLVPITDNVNLQMTYIIGGSVITATNYKYANNALNSTGGAQTSISGSGNFFRIGAEDMSNGNLKNINGEMYIYNPSETSFYKSASWRVFYHLPANTLSSNHGGGTYGSGSAAVTGVQFKYNTGNMDEGIIKLYGIT